MVILMIVVNIDKMLIKILIGFFILLFKRGCKVLDNKFGLFLWNCEYVNVNVIIL